MRKIIFFILKLFLVLFLFVGIGNCAIGENTGINIEEKNINLENEGLKKHPARFNGRISTRRKYEQNVYKGYTNYIYTGSAPILNIHEIRDYDESGSLRYTITYSYNGLLISSYYYYSPYYGSYTMNYEYNSSLRVTRISLTSVTHTQRYFTFTYDSNARLYQKKQYITATNTLELTFTYYYNDDDNLEYTSCTNNQSGILYAYYSYLYDENNYLQYCVVYNKSGNNYIQGNYIYYDLDSSVLYEYYYNSSGQLNSYNIYYTSSSISNYDPFYPLFVYNLPINY